MMSPPYGVIPFDEVNGLLSEEVVEFFNLTKTQHQAAKTEATEESAPAQGSFKLTGKIDGKHDVDVWVNVDGDKISGKYAYLSTLKKYGDRPESYTRFEGSITPTGSLQVTATSGSESAYWVGNFNGSRLYAEKQLPDGQIRNLDAHI